MSFRNSFIFNTAQPQRQIKGNTFFIKSLSKNSFIRFDKNCQTIEFDYPEENQNIDDYAWVVSSYDQDKAQMFQLRFGEFIEIFQPKKNIPLDKTPFLIEFYNNNINQQTFAQMEDTLVQNQPCLLKNVFTNKYLFIKDGSVQYKEKLSIENCFQLILQPGEQTYLRISKHPKIANPTKLLIRNYRTGHYLISKPEQGCTINQNPMLWAQAFLKKKDVHKWLLQYDCTKQNLEYQLIHAETQQFAQNLTTQINEKDKKLYIDLSVVQPQQFWNILSLEKQPPTFGVPFLIQSSTNKYFLSEKISSTNVSEVIIQPDVTNDSLWIVFEHY